MKSKPNYLIEAGVVLAMFAALPSASGQAFLIAKPPPLETAKAAVPKAAEEKARAQTAADQAAAASRAAAEKAGAADATARKAIAEKAAADKTLANAQAAVAALRTALPQTAPEKKAAAEKAIADADARVTAAKAALTEREKDVKETAQAAAPAKAAADKLAAAKREADKVLATKTNEEKNAIDRLAAEEAYVFVDAAAKAAAEKTKAEREADAKAAAARRTAEQSVAAKAVADKAAADQAAAEKSLAAAAATNETAARKALDAKIAGENAAADKAAAEKSFAEAVEADKAVAKKTLDAKIVAAKTAADNAAAEKTRAVAAEAAHAVARKALDAKIAAAKMAADKASAAKTAAEKAASESQVAQKAVAEATQIRLTARVQEGEARAKVIGGLKPLAADKWDYAKARHLMVRAAFGGTPEEVQALYEMGLHDAVDYLVNIYARPVANIEMDPMRYERMEPWEARLDEDERRILSGQMMGRERPQQATLRQWWLRRMAESPRPLQEKLTLFWHDHFASQYSKSNSTFMMYQQNQLFRTYGCDNYAALLRGIVHDPAMLLYLDNNVNFKGRGNENLGREILELFSLGEGNGYTESDLREAARALTGYSYESPAMQFRFNISRHDETPKTIFGRKGNWNGDDLVDLLLQQRATAGYVMEKLFTFFAYANPEPEVVDTLAQVLRSCSYDLRPTLRNMFVSEQFYSEKAMGSYIKGPAELAVGVIRDLGLKEVNYSVVDSAVNQMGQLLFEPPNVAGWNENRTWINVELILQRYNQIARLVEDPKVDMVALFEGKDVQRPEQVIDLLVKRLVVKRPDAEKRKELIGFLGELPAPGDWAAKRDQINAKLKAVMVLLMSTPESQLG